MTLSERLQTFIALGDYLRSSEGQADCSELSHRAYLQNNWFTPKNVQFALQSIIEHMLSARALTSWATHYNSEPPVPRLVGIVMAGNMPAVGFHDLLAVLMSGHRLLAKLSTQDFVLIHYLIQKIAELNPAMGERITIAERLNAADAFITTGSDNTARYFDYYFGKKPHIIRRNRTSVGLLTGDEPESAFVKLGDDIMTYYGLGCRNISTLLVPADYSFIPLLRALEDRGRELSDNHKYQNNYDYNKSIYLVNGVHHYDNGSLLLTENDGLVSPISVVYYKTYQNQQDAQNFLTEKAAKIQVIASAHSESQIGNPDAGWYPGSVAFGQTQTPTLFDYPDGVDTMAFLNSL